MMSMSRPAIDSYNSDFVEWTARNADLLRQGRFDEVDVPHVIEEIEDLGKNWHRALDSHTYQLIAHLLKWEYQPDYPGRNGWRRSMAAQRIEIRKLLRKAPSLGPWLQDHLEENYADAVELASAETGLTPALFPERCPYTVENILDGNFLP